ncbi:MAG: T9SS type A sorting domain-containing protein [Flavobacteriaceae bacterium]|nr:T9SS type A sorting domain-containing protein [Flavobacteriaceae bacterium]
MKKLVLLALLLAYVTAYSQDPIFTPSMTINAFGVVDSPFGEEVDKIIDGDIATKFLDFELDDGMGFTVDLGGLSYVATSIEITTANDFEERDPTAYEVLGSNDGTNFVSIASGSITCITDRFFTRTFDFSNTEAYMHYRVNYTLACDPTGGIGIPSIQVAETQLYGAILSVDDNALSANVALYPNPSSGTFTIDYTGSEPITHAALLDINGRVIKKIDTDIFTSEKQIQLGNINAGVYFVQIATGSSTINKRIVIK